MFILGGLICLICLILMFPNMTVKSIVTTLVLIALVLFLGSILLSVGFPLLVIVLVLLMFRAIFKGATKKDDE